MFVVCLYQMLCAQSCALFYSILFYSILAISVMSCSEESLELPKTTNGLDDDVFLRADLAQAQQQDSVRLHFGQALAKAMTVQDLRIYIKQKALEQIDGDYDVIYALSKDDIVTGQTTLAELLLQYADPSTVSKYGNNFFTSDVLQVDPYLTIYIPELQNAKGDTWNTAIEIPSVAIETEQDYGNYYKGYNTIGIQTQYVKNNFNQSLKIGVKHNEFVVAVNPINGQTIYGNSIRELITGLEDGEVDPRSGNSECPELLLSIQNLSQTLSDFNVDFGAGINYLIIELDKLIELYTQNCLGIPPPGGGGGCTELCERDCKSTKDHIYGYKITDGDVYRQFREGILRSRYLVFYCVVVFGQNPVTPNNPDFIRLKFIDKRRDAQDLLNCYGTGNLIQCFTGKWIYLDTIGWQVIHWIEQQHGEIIKYAWFEQDKADTKAKLTIGASFKLGGIQFSTNVEITGDPKDDEVGERFIEYCDNANTPGQEYGLGSLFRFNIRQLD